MADHRIEPSHSTLASRELYVQPDFWGATDALGRKLPASVETGAKRNKFVGLFYWTWHTAQSGRPARNVTEILAKNPEAVNDFSHPVWEGTPSGTAHFWGKPVYGYYHDRDEFTLRKNAELIANAGVDVLFFDCTNGDFLWDDDYKFLAKVYKKALAQGINVPKFAFMLNFCPCDTTRTMLRRVYKEFYSDPDNECLFFYWEGKPVIMAHPESLDPQEPLDREILDFFTFRHNEPTYFAADTPYDADRKWWGWCSVYPQTKYGVKKDGSVEQMTVNVAQNANDNGLNAMNSNGGKGVYSRSFAKGDYTYSYDKFGTEATVSKDTPDLCLYGRNFQQQWDYALSVDPDFIFVTGWNELIAGRFDEWLGTPNAFPDQFDYEHSRDCEPTRTVLGDNYYYQLCANIRRYKGLDAQNFKINKKTIDVDGDVSQWKDVTSEFAAYRGSGLGRDTTGWKGLYYKQPAAPNEIILTKCAYNSENVYFMCECEKDITDEGDASFMKLLITTPAAGENSFDGFDFMVSPRMRRKEAVVERLGKGYKRAPATEDANAARATVSGRFLQISVKREALGLDGDGIPEFGFKWCDANLMNGDFLDLYTLGNAVPAGRFYFKA
jgi:hypothetical protein